MPPALINEDVSIPKTLSLLGAGLDMAHCQRSFRRLNATIQVSAGAALDRWLHHYSDGNAVATWNDPLNSAGVSIQGQGNSAEIRNSKFAGNRTGIDINNSNGNSIHNNMIDDNRTGLIFRNQTDNMTVVENDITNNWTVGILFLDGSGGTNVPLQTGVQLDLQQQQHQRQLVRPDRRPPERRFAPGAGHTNLKNFTRQLVGNDPPVVTTANSAEPGYAAQIPVAYGGTATPPRRAARHRRAGVGQHHLHTVPLSGTDLSIRDNTGPRHRVMDRLFNSNAKSDPIAVANRITESNPDTSAVRHRLLRERRHWQ